MGVNFLEVFKQTVENTSHKLKLCSRLFGFLKITTKCPNLFLELSF